MVVTKGALTGAITTSNSGGHWGPELKFAGYDMIIVEGRAAHPVYLWIHNDQVELRSAEHLWGKGVWDTEETICARSPACPTASSPRSARPARTWCASPRSSTICTAPPDAPASAR